MKELSSLALRNHLGEILDEVRVTGQPVTVVRHRRPIVQIVPYRPPSEAGGVSRSDRAPAIVRKWPMKFRHLSPSPDLVGVVGAGEKVALEEEKERIREYLASTL